MVFGEIEYRKSINLVHILVVAPFLYYLAYRKGNVNPRIYTGLMVTAVIIALFHSYKLVNYGTPAPVEEAPVEEAPVEEPTPVEEPESVEEPTPVEADSPVSDAAPVEEPKA